MCYNWYCLKIGLFFHKQICDLTVSHQNEKAEINDLSLISKNLGIKIKNEFYIWKLVAEEIVASHNFFFIIMNSANEQFTLAFEV